MPRTNTAAAAAKVVDPTSATPIQTLKLADDLMRPIRDGAKRVTLRNGRRNIQLGLLRFESVNGTEPDLLVNVTKVMVLPLECVPNEVLDADGFIDTQDALECLRRFYPEITEKSEVTAIEFVYVKN